MKSMNLSCVVLAVAICLPTMVWAETMGVPYQYGDFIGSFNIFDERQAVYGDFNGDGNLDHVISDPENNVVYYWRCGSGGCPCTGDYFADLDLINPWNHSMYAHDMPDPHYENEDCYEVIPHDWFERSVPPDPQGTVPIDPFFLGSSLAAGDFNDDGCDDLVIGVPVSTIDTDRFNAGSVHVLIGGHFFPWAATPIVDLHQGASTWGYVGDTPESGDAFGATLAVGDFNCDGYDDLAVGAPNEDLGGISNAGMVHTFYGTDAGAGHFAAADIFIESDIPGRMSLHFEYFGASLAAGRYNDQSFEGRRCYSLAVGAPGEDTYGRNMAGEAYVFLAASGDILRPVAGRVQVINQNYGAIYDIVEPLDMFASTLGSIGGDSQGYDGLWIGVSRQDFTTCYEWEHQPYHRLDGGPTGIEFDSDAHYCGMFSPEVVEQRGVISEVATEYGTIGFFVPSSGPITRGGALIHGTYGGNSGHPDWDGQCDGTSAPVMRFAANEGAFNRYADFDGIVLVFPEADHDHFGNYVDCMSGDPSIYNVGTNGAGYNYGYRGTFGGVDRGEPEPWGFDEWFNYIFDELTKVDVAFGEKMLLFGHSGGAQFVSRYLWEHSYRVRTAVISSPGNVLWPDSRTWPLGYGDYKETQNWPDWGPETICYDPSDEIGALTIEEYWEHVILENVNVHVVVEEWLSPGVPNTGKIDLLRRWVKTLRAIEPTPTFCLIEDATHGSMFDGHVPGGGPIDVYGDEPARQLFRSRVNDTGYCMEVID